MKSSPRKFIEITISDAGKIVRYKIGALLKIHSLEKMADADSVAAMRILFVGRLRRKM
ncbi:hypothetical protein OAM04_02555 [bacterium]|nr:hypothetical protein [bacterium]